MHTLLVVLHTLLVVIHNFSASQLYIKRSDFIVSASKLIEFDCDCENMTEY